MPKKDTNKDGSKKLRKLRADAYEELFGFKEKMVAHIKWSLSALKPCPHCSVKYLKDEKGNVIGMEHMPGKAKDENGNCKFCHAKSFIPNEAQRNWAWDRVGDRIMPSPKAVEVSDETERDNKELQEKIQGQSTETLLDIQKRLGLNFND